MVALAQDIGSRPAGSDAESAAADYIADQLTSYGFNTVIDPFELQYYVEQVSHLEVLSPASTTLDAITLRLSASGETSGGLLAAGIGGPEDFPPEGMAGRLALIQRGELTFSDKVANATAAGASAVIVYNNEQGAFQGDLESESAIPAVGVSREDGQRLLDLLDQGPVSVHLLVEEGLRKATSRNVVARPPDGLCRRLVGAHYDSVEAGPGANDNASGVAALLETARVLASGDAREGVCFAAFGAEEVGLVGSHHFVAELSMEERQTLEGMINLDMVGVGDQWWLFGSDGLVTELDAGAAALGLDPVPVQTSTKSSSDQNSFLDAGITALLLHRFDDPRYHTAEDQAQFVDPQLLQQATEMALLTLDLLEEPSPP